MLGHNQPNRPRELPTSGLLTVETWQCLLAFLADAEALLAAAAGSEPQPSPSTSVENLEALSERLKQFQLAHSLVPDGAFNPDTLRALWKEAQLRCTESTT